MPEMHTLEALRRGDLAGARSLTLRCGLTEFPREILDLADTLEVLDLSGNALTSLPDDIGRLKKLHVLFCSGNGFRHLPAGLGSCPALSQIGARATGLREIPAEALPPALRWLTVTDNQLETVPKTLGERPALQKLLLSGNRLRILPDSLASARQLELMRLSANNFEKLPSWIAELPGLAWLAWAGNPLDAYPHDAHTPGIDWSTLQVGGLLGEGASGEVRRAVWHQPDGISRDVALKLFKGAMTSDGLPDREMAAALAAGAHPHLIGALGRLVGHPQAAEALVMPLVPHHWQPLAQPPSLQSCTRDVYDPAARFSLPVAVRVARGIGNAAAHLHESGMLHGDLYAHNTLWDGTDGQAALSDFGAASFFPATADQAALRRIEVRAWGLLLGELLDRCTAGAAELAPYRVIQQACVDADIRARPSLVDAIAALGL